MGKIRILYQATNGDSIHIGSMNKLSEVFNTDAHYIRNCYYVNRMYCGYTLKPIGTVENVVIFNATKENDTHIGTKEEIAELIGCKPKTVRNGSLVKGYYIRRKGTEERVIDEQSIFNRAID